jgi:hypothetical protein
VPKKSPKQSDAPAKQSLDGVVQDVVKDFDTSWKYTSGTWHDRWRDNNFLYNNQRVKRGYIGISDTFVPMCFSTVETLTSALFGAKPKYNFIPPHNRQDQDTDILNSLIDFYWDKDQWSLKNINTGRGMLKLGTSIDYYCWERDHPVKLNIPIRDFFIDPTASSLENARYMGRRYLITKAQLEEYEVVDFDAMAKAQPDPETGEVETIFKPKYKNLDKLDGYKTLETTDKEEKDLWYGSTLDNPPEDQVEVIEYWTPEKTISIANRTVVIEDTKNYYLAKSEANGDKYPKGIMPFNDARDYVDESLFYAKGEIDFIADQQEDLNDISNQNKDAISYALNQMYTLDPSEALKPNEVENLPGAVYPAKKDSLVPIPHGTIPSDAFAERQNIKNEIRETTASNEVVKGSPTEGGKATATEVNAQVAGAGQRLSLKVTQLENGYFHREARIIFAMIKLYVTEPMMVRIVGKDGVRWEQFDPAEFRDEYEPRVQLDVTIENKKQKEAAEAKELLGAFLNDPDVNQQELKKLVLARSFSLDPDEVEALMQPPALPQTPPEMMAPPAPVAPPNPLQSLFPSAQPQQPQGALA